MDFEETSQAREQAFFNELSNELIETRNQSIKTDNSIRNLSSDLKQIARRQESYERRLLVSSIASYIIFSIVIFSGLFLYFKAGIARTEVDHALVDEQQEGFEQRITELEAEIERRRESEREAYAFYELLVNGSQDEVIERFSTVQGRLIDRATIELFRREVDRIRHDVARDAYLHGITQVEAELWQEARDAFVRSLEYVEEAAYTSDLQYQLAKSLQELNEFREALRYFDIALDSGELGSDQRLFALFKRAEALGALDRYQESNDAYRSFARRYPNHRWAGYAYSRIERNNRHLGQTE